MAYHRQKRQSRRMALCGLLTALSAVLLCLGSLVPLATFACPLLAMGCVVFLLFDRALAVLTLLYRQKRR